MSSTEKSTRIVVAIPELEFRTLDKSAVSHKEAKARLRTLMQEHINELREKVKAAGFAPTFPKNITLLFDLSVKHPLKKRWSDRE